MLTGIRSFYMWHCVQHIWREKVVQDKIGLMTESVLLAGGLITGPALYKNTYTIHMLHSSYK